MSTHQRPSRQIKVLFVLPPSLPTPPTGYGGIEAVAAALLPELKAAGVQTIITAADGSRVAATKRYELSRPLFPILSHEYIEVAPAMETYAAKVMAVSRQHQVDVIHDFSGLISVLGVLAAPLPWSTSYPPVVHTIHGPVKANKAPYVEFLHYPNLTYTAISHDQLAAAPQAMQQRARVVYNGLRPADYPKGPGGHRLLVMGRICRDKGQDRLVEYCANVGLELDIAGTVAEMSSVSEIEAEVAKGEASSVYHQPTFRLYRRMRPFIDGQHIAYHGNVSDPLKHQLLGSATALVVPNRWAEPFGMVAIEAMASGTPVVAMKSGALPELIVHGVTGYLADTFEELCHYLQPKYLAKINRDACRQHVAQHFAMKNLAQEYMSLYRDVIEQANQPGRPNTAAPEHSPIALKP